MRGEAKGFGGRRERRSRERERSEGRREEGGDRWATEGRGGWGPLLRRRDHGGGSGGGG